MSLRFELRSTTLPAAIMALAFSTSLLLAETESSPPPAITFAWPIEGPAERGFGQPDPDGGIVKGVYFTAKKDTTLRAAADGTALYVGPFRSFGSLLILDHGCGLHSILAGSLQPSLTIGRKVRRGEQVGSVAPPKQDTAPIYFELRRDGIATDPSLVMPQQGSTVSRTVECNEVRSAEASPTPPQDDPASEAVASPETGVAPATAKIDWTGKWPWPARGEILRAFKIEGNDGIDIAMPEGTDVKAVEKGIVIYAGDGLKAFGNTVLVRHEDGLVTVYGHLSALKSKRGQKARRGDVIGISGKTGAAVRPQLHFEVRKHSAPVDPAAYLSEP